jgi:hypothetical protein
MNLAELVGLTLLTAVYDVSSSNLGRGHQFGIKTLLGFIRSFLENVVVFSQLGQHGFLPHLSSTLFTTQPNAR